MGESVISDEYLVHLKGKNYGPLTLFDLKELLEGRHISVSHFVYSYQNQQWMMLGEIPEFGLFVPPRPDVIVERPIFYTFENGEVAGPMTKTELVHKIEIGELSSYDYIFIEGQKDWIKLKMIKDFRPLFPAPPQSDPDLDPGFRYLPKSDLPLRQNEEFRSSNVTPLPGRSKAASEGIPSLPKAPAGFEAPTQVTVGATALKQEPIINENDDDRDLEIEAIFNNEENEVEAEAVNEESDLALDENDILEQADDATQVISTSDLAEVNDLESNSLDLEADSDLIAEIEDNQEEFDPNAKTGEIENTVVESMGESDEEIAEDDLFEQKQEFHTEEPKLELEESDLAINESTSPSEREEDIAIPEPSEDYIPAEPTHPSYGLLGQHDEDDTQTSGFTEITRPGLSRDEDSTDPDLKISKEEAREAKRTNPEFKKIQAGDSFEISNEPIWTLLLDGEEYGPYRYLEILKFMQEGQISKSDEVKRVNSSVWGKLGDVYEFNANTVRKVVTVGGKRVEKIFVKRQHMRASYLSQAAIEFEGRKQQGNCTSISVGGCFIETNSDTFEMGQEVQVRIVPSVIPIEIVTKAQVTFILSRRPKGVGVKFIDLSPHMADAILKYVNDYQKKSGR